MKELLLKVFLHTDSRLDSLVIDSDELVGNVRHPLEKNTMELTSKPTLLNEVEFQRRLFQQSMISEVSPLEPICPGIVCYDTGLDTKTRNELYKIIKAKFVAKQPVDHSILDFIFFQKYVKTMYKDSSRRAHTDTNSIIVMEMLQGYETLADLPTAHNESYARQAVFEFMRLGGEFGIAHNDAHLGNVMINIHDKNYFGGFCCGRAIIIDFGRSSTSKYGTRPNFVRDLANGRLSASDVQSLLRAGDDYGKYAGFSQQYWDRSPYRLLCQPELCASPVALAYFQNLAASRLRAAQAVQSTLRVMYPHIEGKLRNIQGIRFNAAPIAPSQKRFPAAPMAPIPVPIAGPNPVPIPVIQVPAIVPKQSSGDSGYEAASFMQSLTPYQAILDKDEGNISDVIPAPSFPPSPAVLEEVYAQVGADVEKFLMQHIPIVSKLGVKLGLAALKLSGDIFTGISLYCMQVAGKLGEAQLQKFNAFIEQKRSDRLKQGKLIGGNRDYDQLSGTIYDVFYKTIEEEAPEDMHEFLAMVQRHTDPLTNLSLQTQGAQGQTQGETLRMKRKASAEPSISGTRIRAGPGIHTMMKRTAAFEYAPTGLVYGGRRKRTRTRKQAKRRSKRTTRRTLKRFAPT